LAQWRHVGLPTFGPEVVFYWDTTTIGSDSERGRNRVLCQEASIVCLVST